MITTVYTAIIKHLIPVTVFNYSAVIVLGENSESYVSGTKQLAVFPLTMKDLRYAPEGSYTIEDKKFYEIGSGTISNKSRVTLSNGDSYRLQKVSDRNFDGGFTVYNGKFIK